MLSECVQIFFDFSEKFEEATFKTGKIAKTPTQNRPWRVKR
jgi:hypothetical protein